MIARRPRRRTLLLAGLLPALLVLALLGKVLVMRHHDSIGRDAFDRGDYPLGQHSFAANRRLNLFERWIAPFDEGTIHHAAGELDDAVDDYETALEVVPGREECTVRINLALAHESIGDALAEQKDGQGAAKEWKAGIKVLADGRCPQHAGRGKKQSKDAQHVDKRLRDKQRQQEQQQQQDEQQPQQQPPSDDQGDGQDPRQDQLEKNNQRGLEQRRQDRELYGGRDYSRPYSW